METPSRSRIFINYRREDTAHVAGRLADDLRRHFASDQVFQDFASIEPGTDFTQAVQHGLDTCAAVLVVIGPTWLTVTDHKGRRRLDLPDDWVAHEVAESLTRPEVRVFPVLVDAEMPAPEDLPEPLRPLTRRQAFPITSRHWANDVADLIAFLKKVPGLIGAGQESEESGAQTEQETNSGGLAKPSLILAAAAACWFSIFAAGLTLDSKTFYGFFRLPLFLLSWTWSNVLALCVIGAAIGGLGSRLMNRGAARLGTSVWTGAIAYVMVLAVAALTGEAPKLDDLVGVRTTDARETKYPAFAILGTLFGIVIGALRSFDVVGRGKRGMRSRS